MLLRDLPIFQHEKDDLRSFRLLTSQLIIHGSIWQADIVRTFAIPRVTVRRYVKLLQRQGAKGFFVPPPRR
jgi:hypothetical protein